MLNWFAKMLLVATSLSPMLGAVAVNQLAHNRPRSNWLPWLVVALALAFICWGLLHYLKKSGEKYQFTIGEFEEKDKELLAFLLTYLLPFLATDKLEFKGEWMTGVYIMGIIVFAIIHAGAFHFNPVMGLLYHFYGVKDENGMSILLISRKPRKKAGEKVPIVKIAHNIYLVAGEENA
jgi:MFS family permease